MNIDLFIGELNRIGVKFLREDRYSFINLKLKEFPYVTVRIDERSGFRPLNTETLGFRSFKWNLYERRYVGLASILKKEQDKLEKILVNSKRILERMRIVLQWTSTPGRHDLIPEILKLGFKSKTLPLLRGMTVNTDTLKRILTSEHPSEYSSWTSSKKNAMAYSKGKAGAEAKRFAIVLKARIKPILNVKEFIDRNPNMTLLAEAGYFGLEPGTLYEDEYIAQPFNIKRHHILEVRELKNGKYKLLNEKQIETFKEPT